MRIDFFFVHKLKKIMILRVLVGILLISSIVSAPLQIEYATTLEDSASSTMSGSQRGGTTVYIRGTGFDDRHIHNNIVTVGGKDCIIPAEGATSSFLICETTDSGSNSDQHNQQIVVKVVTDQGIKTATAPQKFRYRSSDTPYMHNVYPSSSVAGTILRIYGVHRVGDQGDGLRDLGDFIGVWVGNEQCGLFDVEQGTINYNGWKVLKCQQANTQQAGRYSMKQHVTAGLSHKLDIMQRTSADGTYFEHTVMPMVNSVTPDEGSEAGEKITIEGNGFSNDAEKVEVSVDGVACEISQASVHHIECVLGAHSGTGSQLDSDDGSQVDGYIGGAGWKYWRYSTWGTGISSYSQLKSQFEAGTISSSKLEEEGYKTELQTQNYYGSNYGQIFQGYFKAPKSGNYTFRGAADDNFGLYMSDSYGSATVNDTPIIYASSYTDQMFNHFIYYQETAHAEVELEEGKHYYMELYHVNGGGGGQMQISVEVPNDDNTLRWQTHEVHSIDTSYTYDPEIMNYTLQGADNGTFNLSIRRVNQKTLEVEYNKEVEVDWDASESEFKSALRTFDIYSAYTISVVKTTYDSSGAATNDSAMIDRIQWLVSVEQLRSQAHLAEEITFEDDNLSGDIIWTEERAQDHSPEIGGIFTLDLNGVPLAIWDGAYNQTNIPHNVAASTLQAAIRNAIGSSLVEVARTGDVDTGARWIISYIGVDDDVEDLVLSNAQLTGGNATPSISYTLERDYSSNLLYQPVDDTFLFTASSVPTVHVKVNDILAISDKGYTFTFDSLAITQQTLTGAQIAVTISNPAGENFTIADLTVSMDGTACSGVTGTLTSFTCDLEENSDGSPVLSAGDHNVEVYVEGFGWVEHDGSTPITVASSLDSVTPSTGTDNGGNQVTLTGYGFPADADDVIVELCGVEVEISAISNTQITFVIPACGSTGAMDIQATYDGQSQGTISFTYTSASSIASITGISPASSSPVLKKVMTITGTGFGTDKDALSIHLKNSTGRMYGMKILELTDTEIQCGIPGGLPGDFEVDVFLDGFGTIPASPSTANDFTYELLVTDVSPVSGSYYGGTLVTITGVNFSPELSETLVFVGNELNWFCVVETLSESEITCRTPPYHSDWGNTSTHDITVSNKIIQDSTCGGSCSFTYNDEENSMKISTVNDTEVVSGDLVMITGENFDIGSPVVALTNRLTSVTTEVTPDSASATEVVFEVPNLDAGFYTMRTRVDPNGESNTKILQIGSTLTTSSYDVSTEGGHVSIVGTGFPADDWPNSLFAIDRTSNGIVWQVEVLETSTSGIKISIPAGVDSQTSSIKITNSLESTHTVTVTHKTSKTPELSLSSSTPIASGSSTVVLSRDSLDTEVPDTLYIYNVLAPEDMTTVSYTEDSTNLNFTTTLTAGKYGFKAWYDSYGWAAISDNLDVTASSAYTATADPSSYLGGVITVTGTDISPAAKIIVDGIQGTLIENNAGTSATFAVPAYITPSVVSQYSDTLSKTKKLQGTVISDGGDNPEFATDGQYGTNYESSNQECYVGIDLGEGYEAKIERVRYFPYRSWIIASEYIQGAVIEGSTDGSTYTEIGTVDQTVHAGWNSIMPDISTHYRFIRMRHTNDSECMLAEFQVHGLLYPEGTIADINSFEPSNVTFTDGYNSQTFSNVVEYRVDATPVISDVSPKTGDVFGGYNITITGQYLDIGTAKVMIDGEECVVQGTPSATEIICQVGARSDSFADENTFEVTVNGNTAVIEADFIYVLRWSDDTTWGTDLPPIEGDLVYVPEGMTLYVDQSPPKLEGIIVVGGKLIFADEKDMEIHAGLIIVRGGEFRAGTPDAPYQHDLTFVMYGEYYGKQLPEFGNKVIGCFECKFSMYGQVRDTWTTLDATISAGDTSFTVSEDVDWVAGDQIVVASTDFDHNQAEQREIASISGRIVTVTEAFNYKHVAEEETYGSQTLTMHAEVGLLTRNILMKGDETSIEGEYGSHLMMVGSAENGMVSHVAYTEFTDCGQPQITGRYCIHFHMNGDVPDSEVKGNAVHHSFARILTLHGIHYLHVSYNVGYRVKGHNFFIEDGIETMNVIEYNLAIGSLESWNMMQTDISVASYWVTNPTNHLRYNRAAGGDFYAYWYEIKPHPDGPSATSDVCPQGNPLGESHHNIAHSYVRFGLRIFVLMPREHPCKKIHEDPENSSNSQNPSVHSTFSDYMTYKIGESGLLAEETGDMTFENFIMAESAYAGMEFYRANHTLAKVVASGITIIGKTTTNPTDNATWAGKLDISHGTIAPRTSGWKMENIDYYNFDGNMVILQTCSKCDNVLLYTNTAQEYEVSGITYTNVTSKMLNMIGLKRQIVRDLDGSFSANFDGVSRSSATIVKNWPHIAEESACFDTDNTTKWDDVLLCNESITILRVMFTNLLDKNEFKSAPMKVQLIDDVNEEVPENSTSFTSFYSLFGGMEPMADKQFAYAMPYVAGRIYQAWWLTGIDFTHAAIDVQRLTDDADEAIIFKFNYTQNRELYEIADYIDGSVVTPYKNALGENDTLDVSSCQLGDYTHNNDAGNRSMTVCVTSRGKTTLNQYLDINGIRCRNMCLALENDEFVKESTPRFWSNPNHWPSGQVPAAGENVTIEGEWTMVVDMQPEPMQFLLIDGGLQFPQDGMDMTFEAESIWVRAGYIQAGTSSSNYDSKLTFKITGNKRDAGYVFTPDYAGNKHFVVSGSLHLYGPTPSTAWTKLTSSVSAGDNTIQVDAKGGWAVGDEIGIAPSWSNSTHYEKREITAISGNTITLNDSLSYSHYGGSDVTIDNEYGTLDMRAGVGHLTRNIKIQAGDDAGWGFRVLIMSYRDNIGTDNERLRKGNVILQGVEFIEGGQYDTEKTALQLVNLIGENDNKIIKSSFHNCKSFCLDIENSHHLLIEDNVFFEGRLFHVRALTISDYIFRNNLMIGAIKRPTLDQKELIACYGSWDQLSKTADEVLVQGNLCQGSDLHGFAVGYNPCDDIDNSPYEDNTVGSASAGWIFQKAQSSCSAFSGAKAYGCGIGQIASSPATEGILFKNFMIADSGRAVTLRFGKEGDDRTARFEDSWISAVSRPDCTECYEPEATDCSSNFAVRMLAVTVNGESLPDKFGTGFDVICKQETYDSKAFLSNVTFHNYKQNYSEAALANCGGNVVFKPHSGASDITGSHNLYNVVADNVDMDSWAYFDPPSPSGLGWDGGCGNFFCTGKNNYLIHDYTGDFLGAVGTLIANNSVIGDNTNDCEAISAINGHRCNRTDIGVLEYESIAPDFNTRIMWPVYLSYDGGEYKTKTNAWKEWQWQGNEPLNKRLGRFVSIVEYGKIYNMTFASEPPHDMRLQFQRATYDGDNDDFILIKLHYPRPNSIRIQNRGQLMKPISLLDNNGEDPIDNTTCGSNKFFYENYTVHFVVTGDPDCQVRVSLTNSIKLNARFEMDINDFYESDGETLFIDRMAAVLGITTDRIKVVGVYEGSVVVTSFIQPDPSSTSVDNSSSADVSAESQEMEALSEIINSLSASGELQDCLSAGNCGSNSSTNGTQLGSVASFSTEFYSIEDEEVIENEEETIPGEKSSNIGLIVGVILGASVLVAVSIAGGLYFVRKRAKIEQKLNDDDEQDDERAKKMQHTEHQTLGLKEKQIIE